MRAAADPSERQLLRNELVRLLAFAGRDAEVRRALTDAAGRSLDNPQALDPGIRSTGWGVAVQELGKSFADAWSWVRSDASPLFERAGDVLVLFRRSRRALLQQGRARRLRCGARGAAEQGERRCAGSGAGARDDRRLRALREKVAPELRAAPLRRARSCLPRRPGWTPRQASAHSRSLVNLPRMRPN